MDDEWRSQKKNEKINFYTTTDFAFAFHEWKCQEMNSIGMWKWNKENSSNGNGSGHQQQSSKESNKERTKGRMNKNEWNVGKRLRCE